VDRDPAIDRIQSEQYEFPYHYIPSADGFPMFHRHWAYAPSYIAAIHLVRDWLREIVAEGGASPHAHIDFGCGDGGFLHALSQAKEFDDVRFEGVDMDAKAIEWARSLAGDTRVSYQCRDLFELPEHAYDSGSLIEVFEHIPPAEAPAFVEGLSRALKPGAPLFVTVPSNQVPVAPKHYRHFGFDDLQACFTGRFSIRHCFGFERRDFLVRKLMRLLMRKTMFIETAATSRFIVRRFMARHQQLHRCGRIGLILQNS